MGAWQTPIMASEAQPLPRTRRTQQERRTSAEAKLLQSAMELIAEQGAGRTSLAQIGERAGFSRGIVNHHFGTKAELVRRVITESRRRFGESITGDIEGSGLDALLAIADAYIRDMAVDDPAYRSILVMWAEAAGAGSDLRPSFVDGDREFRAVVRDMVRRGVADGSIRADVNPDAVAAGLVAQLRGLGIELLVDPKGFSLKKIRADLVSTISAGLAPATEGRPQPPGSPR